MRSLNTAAFPLPYNEAFYEDVLRNSDKAVNQFATWRGNIVGAVCSRVGEEAGGRLQLYIMPVAVLAPYRGKGIGTQLIESVLEYCNQHNIEEVSLHVQISNDDAIRFYMSKFQFVMGELVENYYRRIDPPHCYHLYKKLDHLKQM